MSTACDHDPAKVRRRALAVAAGLLLFAWIPFGDGSETLQSSLEDVIKQTLVKRHAPALAALVQVEGSVVGEVAAGVRAAGRPDRVTTSDLWHIGSNTKAFTATLIARLVERGVMRFEDRLIDCFPEFGRSIDNGYRDVTIGNLLSHSAGVPTLTDESDVPAFLAALAGQATTRAQRLALAKAFLAKPPKWPPGHSFHYSNLGFIIAGAVVERRTGKLWEDLIRTEIFEPLGMKDSGFGAPGRSREIDQPRGHKLSDDGSYLLPLDPQSDEADVPAVVGPAGTIHVSLRDWMKFAQDQLDGELGHGKLLQAQTYRRLHQPLSPDVPYALGWGAKLDQEGGLRLLTHTGSNGFWTADIRIVPNRGAVVLVTTNAASEEASAALDDVLGALEKRLGVKLN